jgi:hypothetical protein
MGAFGVLVVSGVGLTASGATTPSEPALAGWPRQFGTDEFDGASGVAVSQSGDAYVTGTTAGSFPGYSQQGAGDVFVAKYDKNGNHKWIRGIGSDRHDEASGVSVSKSGDVYVVGLTYGGLPGQTGVSGLDAFVVKYDKNGNRKWIRQFGTGARTLAYGVAVSATGDVYVTGFADGSFVGSSQLGDGDAFVVKYDKNGNQKWVRQFGSDQYDMSRAVAVSRSGDLYVAGWTYGALPGQSSAGNADAFVVKYDKNGNQKWARQYGSDQIDDGYAVAVSASGDVYSTGSTFGALPGQISAGNGDVYAVKYDNNGNQKWVHQFGTASSEPCDSQPAVVAWGSAVYVSTDTCGAFDGFSLQGGADAVLAKFSATDGTQEWVRQFGAGGDEFASGLAVRGNNNNGGALVTSGYVCGGTVWGQVRKGTAGDCDAFVATFPR